MVYLTKHLRNKRKQDGYGLDSIDTMSGEESYSDEGLNGEPPAYWLGDDERGDEEPPPSYMDSLSLGRDQEPPSLV